MNMIQPEQYGSDVLQIKGQEKPAGNAKKTGAYAELEQAVQAALETYSNVHRGSGHNSLASTHLFEQARHIVLDYMGLDKEKYRLIFCTPRTAEKLREQLQPGSYQTLSSQDIGLPLGVRAMAVNSKALPQGTPTLTGGGTVRLVSPGWVIWASAPDRFEAGTPAIVNIIAFARALQLTRQFGEDAFISPPPEKQSAPEILRHDELEQFSGRELLDQLRQTLVGGSIRVPTVEGARPYINLDNGASTPTFMPVWNVVCQAWRQPRQGQQEVIDEVRSICAGVLGAPLTAYDLIFTSNTTEAINLAAESLQNEPGQAVEPVVLNTLLEHNSNELPWRMLPRTSLVRLPVDAEGFVDLYVLESLLRAYNQEGLHGKKRIKLVAMSGASNVLGVFNNLAEIGRIVHRYGARLLVDAAQLVAHRKIEVEACGIDYLAFSAHKVYAPFGSGVLLARKGLLNFSPAEWGRIQSSGEENVGGIAALGKALLLLQRIGLDLIQNEEQALTARTLRGMVQIPGIKIYGIKDPDSPRFAQKGGVIVFSLKGILHSRIARELAQRGGIGVRYGCHCAHLLVKHLLKINPAVENLQGLVLSLFPGVMLPGVVRVSLGIENSAGDIDTLIDVLGKIAVQPRAGAGSHNRPGHSGSSLQPQGDIQPRMDAFVGDAAERVYALHN